jgi:hypothetical protein
MTKVMKYNAVFQREKDGGYSVWAPSLPGCASELYLDGVEKKYLKGTDLSVNNPFLVPVSVGVAYA